MGVAGNGEYVVFTVCNLAYLPKALVLADSFLKIHDRRITIYLFDRKINVELPEGVADYVWIEDLGVPNIHQLAFKYDITEFSTSLKPYIALHLLEHSENVVFLDPDTCVYSSIAPILNDLSKHPIVLTPHYTRPLSNEMPDGEIGMMRFGSFNLGFFAISRTDAGLEFLRWWCDRCIRLCYFETQFGLSTDQKWVSIAPCLFPNLYVSFNLGYNVAFWNLHERRLSINEDGVYVVNEKTPLIFFHFSSFDENDPGLLSKRTFPDQSARRNDFLGLALEYRDALSRKKTAASKVKYGFDYMSNGDYISPTLRRAYACVVNELPVGHNPFDANGVVGAFAKKNNLVSKNSEFYVSNSFVDIKDHRRKFVIVNLFMRVALRILGPNRFSNFTRLLVYLSSIRQNRSLWKI